MPGHKKNLFDIGAKFEDGWSSDNHEKITPHAPKEIRTPSEHCIYFSKEKRRGKVVTVVKPFYIEKQELKSLLKLLKKKLGTGGTLKENSLEFQGELQEILHIQLEVLGYRFKK